MQQAAERAGAAPPPAPALTGRRRAPGFLGTPEMAVPPLRALVDAGHEVVLVVTRADRRRGRGSALTPSPVKAAATRARPPGHRRHRRPRSAIDAELGVVVAYGRIIKPHVLAALPMVNVHFSLLPRWRGAAPVERALLAGDDVTGVCIMDVEEGLDTGGVYARREVPIGPTTTADELRARARRRSAPSCSSTSCPGRSAAPEPQRGDVDVRREDRRPTSWSSTGRRRPSSSIGGCASAGRGRRSAVAASRSSPPTPADAVARRRARSATTPPPSAPAPAACGWTPCSRRARRRCPGRRSPTAPGRSPGERLGQPRP